MNSEEFDIVPHLAAELARNLTPDEREELDAVITPRVAELFAKAFGDGMWDLLVPFTEDDEQVTQDDHQDDVAPAGGVAALSESELRQLMRDPKYWRDRDPDLVAQISRGFEDLFPGKL